MTTTACAPFHLEAKRPPFHFGQPASATRRGRGTRTNRTTHHAHPATLSMVPRPHLSLYFGPIDHPSTNSRPRLDPSPPHRSATTDSPHPPQTLAPKGRALNRSHPSPNVLEPPDIAASASRPPSALPARRSDHASTTAGLDAFRLMGGELVGATLLGPLLRAPGSVGAPFGVFS
jgi:hypothetical protein